METIKLSKHEYELLQKVVDTLNCESDRLIIKGLFEEESDSDYKAVPFDLKLVNNFGCHVTTKSGREVRIVCQDRKGNAPIVGLIVGDNNDELLMPYGKDGVAMGPYFCDENMDLVCLIKKRTVFAYVYEDEYHIPHIISVNDSARLVTSRTKIVDRVQVGYYPKH